MSDVDRNTRTLLRILEGLHDYKADKLDAHEFIGWVQACLAIDTNERYPS